MKKRFCAALLLGLTQLAAATPTQLLQNGDFENHWTGWTVGSDQVQPFDSFLYADTVDVTNSNSGSPAWGLTAGPLNYGSDGGSVGSGRYASNGFDGTPGSYFLSQSFNVTSAVQSAILSFDFGVFTNYGFNPGAGSRSLEFNIYGPSGAGTVFSYTQPLGYSPWANFSPSIDITSFLNQGAGTYTFGFYEHIPESYTGPGLFGIDNISILAQLPESGILSLFDSL